MLAGYWEAWLKPWDAAPGALMVQEAGGTVTTYTGDPWRVGVGTVVATNGQPGLHRAMLDGICRARQQVPEQMLYIDC